MPFANWPRLNDQPQHRNQLMRLIEVSGWKEWISILVMHWYYYLQTSVPPERAEDVAEQLVNVKMASVGLFTCRLLYFLYLERVRGSLRLEAGLCLSLTREHDARRSLYHIYMYKGVQRQHGKNYCWKFQVLHLRMFLCDHKIIHTFSRLFAYYLEVPQGHSIVRFYLKIMSSGVTLQHRLSESILMPEKFVWYQKKALKLYLLRDMLLYLLFGMNVVAKFVYWKTNLKYLKALH